MPLPKGPQPASAILDDLNIAPIETLRAWMFAQPRFKQILERRNTRTYRPEDRADAAHLESMLAELRLAFIKTENATRLQEVYRQAIEIDEALEYRCIGGRGDARRG